MKGSRAGTSMRVVKATECGVVMPTRDQYMAMWRRRYKLQKLDAGAMTKMRTDLTPRLKKKAVDNG